jgi:methylphosphotriester-DNA--protein-cysteine methyltransferase
MRPPLVSDEAIRAAIRELASQGGRVTGVAVRHLLAERHGARCGVSRIYRIVHDSMTAPARPAAFRPTPRSLSDESRAAAIERADLAEHRELAHQERWARDTDALRTRLAAAEADTREAKRTAQRITDLTRALASAQARIAALEQQLAERAP